MTTFQQPSVLRTWQRGRFFRSAARFHCVLLLTAALLCAFPGGSPALRAQSRPAATGPGSYLSVGGGGSIFQADYGQRDLGGLTAYVDLNPTWRYGIEAEARTLRYNTSEDVTETTWLAGPRITILPGRLRPYGKFLLGAGKIVLPFRYAEGTFLTLAPGAGVEYDLTSRLILRPIDVEYQFWRNFPYGPLHPYGVSVGLSFRLNPPDRYPKAKLYRRR